MTARKSGRTAKKRLLLASVSLERSVMSLPLAAGILKAELDASPLARGLETEIVFLTADELPAEVARGIASRPEPPDYVGVSAYLWNEAWLLAFAASLRSALPGTVLFAGGPEAQAAPGRFLEGGFAFVAAGDGEALIVAVMERLLAGASPDGLPGVLSPTAPRTAARPAYIESFAERPSPFLSGALDPLSQPGVLWETTRGCPYSCAFCYESRGRRKVRSRPLRVLEAELELFARLGVARVFVLDPSFNADRKRALEILRLIAQTAPGISYTFEIRAEGIDADLAEAFASIDSCLQIGLQSSDPAVLAKVGRSFDPERFAAGCRFLAETGAVYGFDLVYGLPGDTCDGFVRSLDFAVSLRPANLDIFPLAVLPGTALADEADSFGLVRDEAAPFLVRGNPTFPPTDLERARRLKSACDELYTRRKAAPWFLPLTEPLGLGPSEVFDRFNLAFDPGASAACDFSDGVTRSPGWPSTEDFLAALYRERGREGLFPAARSWLRVSDALAAIAGGSENEPLPADTREFGPETRLVLSPGLALVRLDYRPEDLEELPELGLDAFAAAYATASDSWLVYSGDAGPVFEPLDEEESAFLAACDGKTALRDFPDYGGEGFSLILERIAASGAMRAKE